MKLPPGLSTRAPSLIRQKTIIPDKRRDPNMLIEKVIEKAFGLLPAMLEKVPNLQITVSQPTYNFATQQWSADFVRVGIATTPVDPHE
jgi:hypothetical protein